jgi:hypothetical protein
MNANLVDHDVHLGGGAAERLPGHGDQAQAIVVTFFVVIKVLLGTDQILSHRTIDEGGLQRVCNHRVQAGVMADTKHREQDVNGMILPASD